MEYLKAILNALTPAAVASVLFIVIGWVAKESFARWLASGTERYKAELNKAAAEHQAQLDKSAAEYKASLDRTLFEYQTRFTELHERRATVIAEFYAQLQSIEDIYVRIVENVPSDAELVLEPGLQTGYTESFDTAYDELRCFFQRNRIFFSEALCRGVDQMLHLLAVSKLFFEVSREREASVEERSNFAQAARELRQILGSTKCLIESEFRTMLGVVNCKLANETGQ